MFHAETLCINCLLYVYAAETFAQGYYSNFPNHMSRVLDAATKNRLNQLGQTRRVMCPEPILEKDAPAALEDSLASTVKTLFRCPTTMKAAELVSCERRSDMENLPFAKHMRSCTIYGGDYLPHFTKGFVVLVRVFEEIN